MKKCEEINLVLAMIADTEKELMKDRKDRLQLEEELRLLKKELDTLRCSSKSIAHQNGNSHEKE